MKTKEELNTLKEEVETVSRKLHELTDEELAQVTGGVARDDFGGSQPPGTQKIGFCKYCNADKLLTYVGNEIGWCNRRNMGSCNKWRCPDCQCDNYYTVLQGFLLP